MSDTTWHKIHSFTNGWLWSRGRLTDAADTVTYEQLHMRGIAFEAWPTLPVEHQDEVLYDLKLERDHWAAISARRAPGIARAQRKYEHAYRERNKHPYRKSKLWFKWQTECLRWKRRGAFGHFDEIVMPRIKAAFPKMDIAELCAVQPMTRPNNDMADALAWAIHANARIMKDMSVPLLPPASIDE